MKILLTGGAGFIGSHVAQGYLDKGYRVIVIDDFSMGKEENIPEGVEFYKTSILDRKSLERIIKKEKIALINHHAAQSSISVSLKDPKKDFEVNVSGSVNLLEFARHYKIPFFVFASSGGAIYGEKNSLPVRENEECLPLSPYGLAKKVFEEYLHLYSQVFGIRYVSLRYGNVFGPKQDPYGEAGVIAIFSYKMLKGMECMIYGDGNQERDFVYISDVVLSNIKATEYIMDSSSSEKSCVLNIGTGKGTSVNEIFKILSSITNYKKRPVYLPARKGEIKKIAIDYQKAKENIGWQPCVSLKQGLNESLRWFNERIKERLKV